MTQASTVMQKSWKTEPKMLFTKKLPINDKKVYPQDGFSQKNTLME